MFRILGVELNGIKDVNHGKLLFREDSRYRKGDFAFECPGVIGIYGQNGSGKTSIIDSFKLLKILASGVQIYEETSFSFIVSRWLNKSKVSFDFYEEKDGEHFLMTYSVRLGSEGPKGINVSLEGESFSSFVYDVNKKRFVKYAPDVIVNFLDQESTNVISPDPALQANSIFGHADIKNIDVMNNIAQLMALKTISFNLGTSYLFSDKFLSILAVRKYEYASRIGTLLNDLRAQIRSNLFVYSVADEAISNFGLGELFGIGADQDTSTIKAGVFPFQTSGPFFVADSDRSLYDSLIKQINIVLPSFVPNFALKFKDIGPYVSPSGKIGKQVVAVSVVNGVDIPLVAESNGIKKIVSVCSAIVHMYNRRDVWLAIDEFDSGVFEFLFGQILQIIGESAKGQIIFTSHNLRPLEVLNHNDLYVSTTNPEDRYVKLVNIKPTNNVRDFYFRALQIGGQKEKLYNETEASEIALALRRGGKVLDELNNKKSRD